MDPTRIRQAKEHVERVLDPFMNDLWIQRRLALDEVIDSLKLESKKFDEHHRDEVPDLRRQTCHEYIRFIEFLNDQCTGQHFTSDKQWGHLLNLMSVSRKVNQRSAKFSDIIKSKQHIESNFQDIRHFNESVKQASMINDTLRDLAKNLESCQLIIEFSSEKSHHSLIAEVSKAIRQLENNSAPLAYNLRIQLYSKSIDPRLERDREALRDTFCRLESILSALFRFLNQYFGFLKNLAELRPLLKSVGVRNTSSDNSSMVKKGETLQSLLKHCLVEFDKVIRFDRGLTGYLKAHMKQTISESKGEQQVRALYLHKLLDSRQQYKDEMLDIGLKEADKSIRSCQENLDHIKRSLRLEFGRFYFVNDLELLTLIALDVRLIEESNEPSRQMLICKIFNNSIMGFSLSNVEGSGLFITGIKNSIDENIEFEKSDWIPLKKRVNIFSLEIVRILNEVLRKLRRSLSFILERSIESWIVQRNHDHQSATNDIDWTLPIQLLDLAEHVKFTHRVECQLSSHSPTLKPLIEYYEAKLHGLRSMTSEADCNESNALLRLKISAEISTTVHFIAILINLDESSVRSRDHWDWRKYPRFYPKHSPNTSQVGWQLEVRIAIATFVYRFDLLSIETTSELNSSSRTPINNVKRLISTRTSDRCFLAASQAIFRLKSGASPFGPAGSGKTETIKALGHLLGCQVIVHNCDETNDAESLERLIWGLAHTGLWGCFDEFNRLSAATLSSVSSTLEVVQASLRSSLMTIELDGGEIKSIDPDSAFFVTLNPGDGLKYRGRRRLPANIRGLFQPVAMFQVQIDAIVQQMLLVHTSSSNLAAGSRTISYQLDAKRATEFSQRLSRWIQVAHSEFGNTCFNRCEFDLRLVLVILRRLFHLLSQQAEHSSDPSAMLDSLLISSIQMEVCPRLGQEQLHVFEKTLSSCLGPCVIEKRQDKTIQLQRQLERRSGVILLGGSQTGKSTCWQSLLSKLNKDQEIIFCSTLNPKAYDKERLFGYFECSSGRWIDGVFTKLVRLCASKLQGEPSVQQAWIILDGSIEPDWIECLNSVLDDNQLLTLSSGERINFIITAEKCIKLIFETDSIQYASPATISRLGLVFYEKVDGQRYVHNDIQKLTIVYGGASSRSRLRQARVIADPKRHTLEYGCNKLCNSVSLIELMQISPHAPCNIIIQNLELIGSEDKWDSKTFIELLRYMITYRRYYDKNLDEIKLSDETRFIVTVDSLRNITDERLLALAKISEAKEVIQETVGSCETLYSFIKNQVLEDLDDLGIFILLSQHGLKTKQDLILNIQTNWSARIDLCKFNNQTTQAQSMERLEQIARVKNTIRTEEGRKCVFLIDSLELSLMEEANKRKLSHLINLLLIKKLIGPDTKIIVCLDDLMEVDTKFWFSVGRSYSIATNRTSLQGPPKIEFGSEEVNLPEWLWQEVTGLVGDRESVVGHHFVGVLAEMIAAMRDGLSHQIKMLKSGVDKMREFESSIEEIKSQRQTEDERLRVKKLDIEKLMQQIDLELEKSGRKNAEIRRLQEELKSKSAALEIQTSKIQGELDRVLPLIETSKKEVNRCLKPEALNEIKSLRAPPKTIKDILDVLFVFLDVQDSSWASVKAYLTRTSLRDQLTNYDFKKRLDRVRLEKIKRDIELRQDSFRAHQAKRASNAVLPILNWINAAIEYGEVSVEMKPLMEARDRLKREAQESAELMSQLESERQQLEEKVSEDRNLLRKYESDYKEAMKEAERMAAELSGAQKILENSKRQVSSWHERLSKLEALATSDKNLYRVCLICAAVSILAEDLDDVGQLLKRFGHKSDSADQLQSFLALTEDNVNILLDAIGEERIETSTVKREELNLLLNLIRLELCMLFKSHKCPRQPYILFKRSKSTIDGQLAATLSTRNIFCTLNEFLIVRTTNVPIGSWRQKFDLGLKMNKLMAVQLDKPDLEVVDAVLEHCGAARIIMFGELAHNHAAKDPINQLLHIFSIDQQSNHEQASMTNLIGNLLLQHCNPGTGLKISKLEKSLVAKQREERTLESSLLKKLNQSREKKNIQSSSRMELKSDLVRTLNELQKATEGLAANIQEIKYQLAEYQSSHAEYIEVSARLAKFYDKFLPFVQGSDNFYSLSLETLVKLLLNSCSGEKRDTAQIVFGAAQLVQILTHVMCSLRPECRAKFRHQLLASTSDLASLINSNDPNDLVRLIEISYKTSADLCHNLTNLLAVEKNCYHKSGPLIRRERNCNFELVIILHDEKKPSPQVVVDELLKREAEASFISKDNECHYHKVYATSQRQASAASNGDNQQREQPLAAHLRRLMMSPSTSTGSDHHPSRARTQTKCICIANAHLAVSWINAQFLGLLKESCWNLDERYVFLLICESREQHGVESTNTEQPCDKLERNLLEAATLKFWYDELTLNALDRYNLYLGPLRDAYASTARMSSENHKSMPLKATADSTGQTVISSDEHFARDSARRKAWEKSATGELIGDLVMFHVVCQELIRLKRLSVGHYGGLTLWRKTDYNFDYEQLSIAIKIWSQISEDATHDGVGEMSRRELFCHLLESIVYGSRLETVEDEELLKLLLSRFMQTSAISDTNVRGERLLALELLARNDLSASLDGASRARYANELARLIGAAS